MIVFILTRVPLSVTSVRRELLFVGLLTLQIRTIHSRVITVSLLLLRQLWMTVGLLCLLRVTALRETLKIGARRHPLRQRTVL